MSVIKKTLLQIVQDILSDTDGEPINSLSDSLEGEQLAVIVEHAFYDMVALREIPEHKELIKLVPLSNSVYPTHFYYPENVTHITDVWYDTSDDDDREYSPVRWCEPEEFLRLSDGKGSDWTAVVDINSGTTLRITNNKHPQWYTSFDDYYIIMDSWLSTEDDTLQESKIRAMGTRIPEFDRFNDDYIPDIDASYFPHLIAESRARAMDFFKGGVTQKAEQASRRSKSYMRDDRYRTNRANVRNKYGRHG